MAADTLQVELVAADRTVWSGTATMVIARTVEGDVGVLRGHAPLLSLLTDAVVEITGDEGDVVVAAVDGGFLSVAGDRVSILSEHAVLAEDIDVDKARVELDEARGGDVAPDETERRIRRAEARIRARRAARNSPPWRSAQAAVTPNTLSGPPGQNCEALISTSPRPSSTATAFQGAPTQKPSISPEARCSTMRGGGVTTRRTSRSGSIPA
jgi:F-type H+-transporting ATPase subunit epsilon